MGINKSLKLLVAFGFLFAMASMMFGQAVTASSSLAGTVTDRSGAVVVGATVMAVDAATGSSRTATTNNLGAYGFDVLRPGIYSAQTTITALSTSTAPSVELPLARTTTQDS